MEKIQILTSNLIIKVGNSHNPQSVYTLRISPCIHKQNTCVRMWLRIMSKLCTLRHMPKQIHNPTSTHTHNHNISIRIMTQMCRLKCALSLIIFSAHTHTHKHSQRAEEPPHIQQKFSHKFVSAESDKPDKQDLS